MTKKLMTLRVVCLVLIGGIALAKPSQPLGQLTVTPDCIATVEVMTDHGQFEYHLDNSGAQDVSTAMQEMFDRVAALEDSSATFNFYPGVYFIDAPVTVKMVSLELRGNGHGGLDVHGMDLKSGTIFQFGENTGPNCLSFQLASHSKSFPGGEAPWTRKNCKVQIQGMTFMGYNNTGVDTDSGYSRFRKDTPNFRGLNWYPARSRYADAEAEGQRALVFPTGWKPELLRINSCYFTDLYVGVEIDSCDVSYITDSWFAQLVYGIRYKKGSAVAMVENNCFADLETGVVLNSSKASNLNGNAFAYVSKCFEVRQIADSTISHNTVTNWKKSTGAAAFGAFCYVGSSENLVMLGNSIRQEIDSRAKTITIDDEPNGRAFVQIENSKNLMFANNVINTVQTQTVVALHGVKNSAILDNLITFGEGGNAVAQVGDCSGNMYRPIAPELSAPFDVLK